MQSWQDTRHDRNERLERALNISNAGDVLLQTYINRVVQQISLRELGIQATLPRKPGTGNAAYINQRTPGTTGGEWVADTDAASEETGTYAQTSFTYRTLVTRGKVTRKVQATGRSYGDALGIELAGKSEDFSNRLENGCAVGDNGADANQMNGLLTLVNANQIVAQGTVTSGNAFTLAKLDKAISLVKGRANRGDLRIYCSSNGWQRLNASLQAQQRFDKVTQIAAGFEVQTYNGIPIVESTEIPDTLDWSGSAFSAFSGGTTTAFIIVNTRYCWLEELTPMTVMPLAKASSQYDEFDIFWDGALVVAQRYGMSVLGGVTPE